jgi:hypothetical protein
MEEIKRRFGKELATPKAREMGKISLDLTSPKQQIQSNNQKKYPLDEVRKSMGSTQETQKRRGKQERNLMAQSIDGSIPYNRESFTQHHINYMRKSLALENDKNPVDPFIPRKIRKARDLKKRFITLTRNYEHQNNRNSSVSSMKKTGDSLFVEKKELNRGRDALKFREKMKTMRAARSVS